MEGIYLQLFYTFGVFFLVGFLNHQQYGSRGILLYPVKAGMDDFDTFVTYHRPDWWGLDLWVHQQRITDRKRT